MKTFLLLVSLLSLKFGISAQESFKSWEDSLANQPSLQKLGRDICTCWDKEVDQLQDGPRFMLETLSSPFEAYLSDLEDYYRHDTTCMRLDGVVASRALDGVQNCINELHNKHSRILDEYNYLELYIPLQMYFVQKEVAPGLKTYFEGGILCTHPGQRRFVSIISGLLIGVRGNEYHERETGIDLLSDRMKSIIRKADGNIDGFNALLEVYKSEASENYEEDMQIMEMYVNPNLEEQIQLAQTRFQAEFGVLDSSDLDYYFKEFSFNVSEHLEHYAVEKSLIEMRLSQE